MVDTGSYRGIELHSRGAVFSGEEVTEPVRLFMAWIDERGSSCRPTYALVAHRPENRSM
jgi:hypothetical protein